MTRSTNAAPMDEGTLASSHAFRTIAELAGDVAFIVDCASGQFAYISPGIETLCGDSLTELRARQRRGDGPLALLCEDLPQRLRRLADGEQTGEQAAASQTRACELQRPDGRTVPVAVISTLVLDGAGKPLSLVGLVRDRTAERARVLEQQRFASMLNHEFRTPLSTIDGAVQRLEATGAQADEATRQRYRKIAVATDRLIAMLDDYLSPERMSELGRERPANTVSPRLLLDELVAQARAAGRPVVVEIDALPSQLRCEPAGLRLVCKQLLDNALRFSPSGSPLTVSGHPAGGGVELSLGNTGAGIAAADLPRIFDKGYRGANAAGLPGSGLGLYMARSVAEAHGGSLVHLRPADGGAAFRLWLPVPRIGTKELASAETGRDNRDGDTMVLPSDNTTREPGTP